MRKTPNSPGEKIVKDIKRATRKHYSSEEKNRIDSSDTSEYNYLVTIPTGDSLG